MKLIKLIIHNLASIEDATIDFQQGPLAEDSRFLICGPTGAGKTTLLDAICLALYGTTPRLNIKKVEGYVDEYENFKLGKDRTDIKIDDTRMLMRRGSLNAFVELFFTDKDENRLKIVWRCDRAYNKPDGNIKTPEWCLFDADTDVMITSKKPEIIKEISQRIGLTFEQFCRTTMLAQGDFTKFLKSDEGEKSQILEKLTGTDIYSEISMQIHSIRSEKEVACEKLESKMEGVKLLSEEDKKSLTDSQTHCTATIQSLSNQQDIILSKIKWINQLQEYIKSLDEVKKLLELRRQEEHSERYIEEQGLLTDWQNTIDQREMWKSHQQLDHTIKARRLQIDGLHSTYLQLSAGLVGLEQKLESKLAIKEKIRTYLEAESMKEKTYQQLPFIESLSQQYGQNQETLISLAKSIKLREDQLPSLAESIRKNIDNVNKIQQLITAKNQLLSDIHTQLSTLNYTELLQQRNGLDAEIAALKDYNILLQLYKQADENLQLKNTALASLQKESVTYQALVREETQHTEAVEKQYTRQSLLFEKQQRACSELMKEYRSMLHEGDICPLCGQEIHSIIGDEHFNSILQPIQEEMEQLRLLLQQSNQKLSEYKAQLALHLKNSQLKQAERSQAEEQLQSIRAKLEAHIFFPCYQLEESSAHSIAERLRTSLEQQQSLDAQLKKMGEIQQQQTLIQKEKDQLEDQKHQLEGKNQDIEKQLTILQENKTADESTRQHLMTQNDEVLSKLSQYIDIESFRNNREEYLSTLKVGAERYQIAQQKATSVETHIQETTLELQHIRQIKKNIDALQTQWVDTTTETIPQSIDNLTAKWMQLQTVLTTTISSLHELEQQASVIDQKLAEYFEQKEAVSPSRLESLTHLSLTDMNQLRDKHQKIRDEQVRFVSQLEIAEKNLADHQHVKPELKEEEDLANLLTQQENIQNEIKTAYQQLGKIAQTFENDHTNVQHFESISKKLEKAHEELNKWNHLHKLFGSNDGKKFRNIAQSYVLEQLLVNANQYLRQFTDRYEMECQPGSLTILLRDLEAGGVVRPTTTISGGESFLISLSLALGLSSLSRNSFSMDTLFIDEGFGTLDGTYLSAVMDALERLHQMGGKRIGIISHVESLKERLTTQIQVSRVNNTLSKVEVVSLV